MQIEGVEVIVVDEVPESKVLFLAPGHEWNPTDTDVLVCNLETYVSLDTILESRQLVAHMVTVARDAMRAKARAEEIRERRRRKRLLTGH